MKEQEQYLGLLGQLKDYDEVLTQELAAKAYQEQERQRLEVSFFSPTSISFSIIIIIIIIIIIMILILILIVIIFYRRNKSDCVKRIWQLKKR